MELLASGQGTRPVRRPPAVHGAFTVLELLVSVAIVGLLISLLLPAIMCARESARRAVCASHLREVGVAMHSHHSSHQQLPRAWTTAERDPTFVYGWAARLLPELEQQATRQQFDIHQRPSVLVSLGDGSTFFLPLLLCPSDITEKTFDLLQEEDAAEDSHVSSRSAGDASPGPRRLIALPTANYVGVFGTWEADEFEDIRDALPEMFADGPVIHDRRVRFADLCRGLSNTLLVGERTMATVPSTWLGVDLRGQDAPCRLVGSAMTRPNCKECDECEFTSRHADGSSFLWADGRVTLVSNSVETDVYREFARRVAR